MSSEPVTSTLRTDCAHRRTAIYARRPVTVIAERLAACTMKTRPNLTAKVNVGETVHLPPSSGVHASMKALVAREECGILGGGSYAQELVVEVKPGILGRRALQQI